MKRGAAVRWGALSVVLATAVLAAVFASRLGHDTKLSPSPLIGKSVPTADLPLLDGEGSVSLSDYTGKILVVNFFASWCLECRQEHPDLIATADAFAGQDVQFVGISYLDDAAATSRFLDEMGRSSSTVYARDPGSRTAIAFGVFGVPETFFIDPSGTVVGKIQGPSSALLLGETIDKIRRGEDVGQQVVGNTRSSPGG